MSKSLTVDLNPEQGKSWRKGKNLVLLNGATAVKRSFLPSDRASTSSKPWLNTSRINNRLSKGFKSFFKVVQYGVVG